MQLKEMIMEALIYFKAAKQTVTKAKLKGANAGVDSAVAGC